MTDTKADQDSAIARTLGVTQSSHRDSRLKRGLAWTALVVMIIVAVIAWATWDNGDTMRYKSEPVRRGDLTVTVTATGNLEPTNQVDVGSELSGIIKTVEVDYNDSVKVGQVLARLDTSKLEAQVLKSKAALESAQAKVVEAKATVLETKLKYDRCRKLMQRQLCSPEEADTTRAAYARAQAAEASAEAAVSEAQATLDGNETDLAKAVIRSPINGIVLKRSVEPGQTVAASLQAPVLFTLAENLTQMQLHVDVDEADVGQVREGQEATFNVDAYPARTFPARIIQVRYGSQTVEGVVTYETVLNVDNSDLSLRPGMTATADIIVKKVENAILVPNAALRFTPPIPQAKTSSGGSLLSKLFPFRRRGPSRQRENAGADNQAQVWTLRQGQPVAIPITVGSSDGIKSEVNAGAIEPGMELLVDTVSTAR